MTNGRHIQQGFVSGGVEPFVDHTFDVTHMHCSSHMEGATIISWQEALQESRGWDCKVAESVAVVTWAGL